MFEEDDGNSFQKEISEFEPNGSEMSFSRKENNKSMKFYQKTNILIPVNIDSIQDLKEYFNENIQRLFIQLKSKSEIINENGEDNRNESAILELQKRIGELKSENTELKLKVKQYQEENEKLKSSINKGIYKCKVSKIKENDFQFRDINKSSHELQKELEMFYENQKSNSSDKNNNEQNIEKSKINQSQKWKKESLLDIEIIKRKELKKKLKVKGEEKIFAQNFRKEYNLEEDKYPDDKIIKALKENDYGKEEAFASFFK
jgi:hypothetical protein